MFVITATAPGGAPLTFEPMDEDAARKHVIWLRDQVHTFITVTDDETGREVDDETFMRPYSA